MTENKLIWHKLPEQPENGRDVLEKWHHLGIHYTHFVAKNGIAEDNPFTIAWCYLDDLLACEQELITTRKVLDVAMDALNTVTATPLNSRVIHDVANKALEQINEITKGRK